VPSLRSDRITTPWNTVLVFIVLIAYDLDLSWEHLNHTRKECQAMIDEDQKELARVFARLTRNLDTLHQAEYCAHQKTECLAKELEASGILEPLDSRFAAR